MSRRPAAQPKTVLRGHRAQVHVTTFVRQDQRLASGDADGFLTLWDLTILRPRAVWRAHTEALLGIAGWDDDKIITEGRDNRLVVWKVTPADEAALSTALPLDDSAGERPQPWILHILEINTLNFCSFAPCVAHPDRESDELLIAVPNTLSTESVDVYHLPSQNRQGTVHLGSKTEKKGMVMALSLFWLQGSLTLVAAYENGLCLVLRRGKFGEWHIIYKAQVHSQPILSLDVSPDKDYFLTSGADAIIAKHPIYAPSPTSLATISESATKSTPKANDSSIENIEEPPPRRPSNDDNLSPSLLTAALAAAPSDSAPASSSRSSPGSQAPRSSKRNPVTTFEPIKKIDTKHSGQQSLRIRSDGRIFATAGWDSKVRVYSIKTMAELAVFKWHDVSCYSVAFATVGDNTSVDQESSDTRTRGDGSNGEAVDGSITQNNSKIRESVSTAIVPNKSAGELTVKDRRIKMAKEAHWLAAGSKDGKISLWDLY